MTAEVDELKVTTPSGDDTNSSNDDEATLAMETTAYRASIYPGSDQLLPPSLGQGLSQLEAALGIPVWLLLQDDPLSPFGLLDEDVVEAFRSEKQRLPEGEKVALVVNSPGGLATPAYELATLVRRRCGGFIAVVPEAAMSAATLFVLGAESILMGQDAALGPLDVQIWDADLERYTSALNEVQALERLRAYALESIDETMWLLVERTKKRVDTLLPYVLRFIADMTRPLMEKIDVVHYNERARILKVAEEYAIRLLRPRYPEREARVIAARLVEKYPEHGFRIDREEAGRIGLRVDVSTDEQAALLEGLVGNLRGINAVGRLEEVVTNGNGDH